MELELLIRNHLVHLPPLGSGLDTRTLATLLNNFAHYGFGLTQATVEQLARADQGATNRWWPDLEAALREVTGDAKDMGDHVVYKNFPAEVLSKSDAEYWIPQILMYWGLPNDLFTEPVAARDPLPNPDRTLRMLRAAPGDALSQVLNGLLGMPSRWTPQQQADVAFIIGKLGEPVDLSHVPFKENLAQAASLVLSQGGSATVNTATDVLRLATALSDGDPSLRELAKLRSFARPVRRFLLNLLEESRNILEDFARRPERFKRLMVALRPGDYAKTYPRVVEAYDHLYNGAFPYAWAHHVEVGLRNSDPSVLERLVSRPGEFLRRLATALRKLGEPAQHAFISVLPELTVTQLLSIRKFLRTVNDRKFRTIAPGGNWAKLQILDGETSRLPAHYCASIDEAIGQQLRERLSAIVPSVTVDPSLSQVTLPTQDNELTPYGRGTVFPLPEAVTFLRTASFWAINPELGNIWFDNGWNFFDAAWKPRGVCCWNAVNFNHGAAIFSGDPTNSKDLDGKACQMIDLYLDKLRAAGVRYAVWNILCFSHIAFAQADEVFAALQWGSEPQKGNLFEPARVQLAFPLEGESYTKYIAWLDIERRQVVYLDANLKASVRSAAANQGVLSRTLPAFQEYLQTLPTMADLLEDLPRGNHLTAVYHDEGRDLKGKSAWVFQPRGEAGDYEPFDRNRLLLA